MNRTTEGYEIIYAESLYLIVKHNGRYALYDDQNNSVLNDEWYDTFERAVIVNEVVESTTLFSLHVDELDMVINLNCGD